MGTNSRHCAEGTGKNKTKRKNGKLPDVFDLGDWDYGTIQLGLGDRAGNEMSLGFVNI